MIRSLLVAVAVASLFALPACGPTCNSACNSERACRQKVGGSALDDLFSVESCVKSCEQFTTCTGSDCTPSCKNSGAYLDCRTNLKCDSLVGFIAEEAACPSACDRK